MKFAFIEEHLSAYPVEVSCAVLEVSRSGYYAWLEPPTSPRQRRHEALAAKIAVVHQENRCVYGSPRICQAFEAFRRSSLENTVAKCVHAGKRPAVCARKKEEVRATDH